MHSSDASHERPVFERGLAIARRNLLLLLLCVVLVPTAALVFSLLQTPQYTASASLLFGTQGSDLQLFGIVPLTDTDPQREAATNLKLVSVDQVATRTARALDESNLTTKDVSEKVAVTGEGESDLISVIATGESPTFAAQLANEFARQYISFSRETKSAKIRRAQGLIEAKLNELTPAERAGAIGQDLAQRARQLAMLATVQTGNAELAQPATPPTSPSSPKTMRNVALGILLGILLGIGLALLREQLDRRIRDLSDIEDVFDLPVLGTIPQSRAIRDSGPGSELAPTSMEGEAFRMLRANLRYFNVDSQVTSILITSAAPQDGKTTIAWNVALAEARAGERVLFLDADLRQPMLAEHLGASVDDGLSLVLAGASKPAAAIQSIMGVDLLPAGPPPPNPAELIESKRMSELLTWAEREYDRVIVDTPPAAVVADAVSLFGRVSGVVIVTRLQRSPRDAATFLHDQLVNTGAPVLGIVINGVNAPPESGYYQSRDAAGPFAESALEKVAPASKRQRSS